MCRFCIQGPAAAAARVLGRGAGLAGRLHHRAEDPRRLPQPRQGGVLRPRDPDSAQPLRCRHVQVPLPVRGPPRHGIGSALP